VSVQDKIIKTVSYDQEEILSNIMALYCPDGFELDPTYSVGNFYKGKIPQPMYKFDINPVLPEVEQADVRDLPLSDGQVHSVLFDPPFVAAMPKGEASGKITSRFGYYPNVQYALWNFYADALKELYRVCIEEGIIVFKCQDTIDSRKQYLSHVEVIICT